MEALKDTPEELQEQATPAKSAGFILKKTFSLLKEDIDNIYEAVDTAHSFRNFGPNEVQIRVVQLRKDNGDMIKNELQIYLPE